MPSYHRNPRRKFYVQFCIHQNHQHRCTPRDTWRPCRNEENKTPGILLSRWVCSSGLQRAENPSKFFLHLSLLRRSQASVTAKNVKHTYPPLVGAQCPPPCYGSARRHCSIFSDSSAYSSRQSFFAYAGKMYLIRKVLPC